MLLPVKDTSNVQSSITPVLYATPRPIIQSLETSSPFHLNSMLPPPSPPPPSSSALVASFYLSALLSSLSLLLASRHAPAARPPLAIPGDPCMERTQVNPVHRTSLNITCLSTSFLFQYAMPSSCTFSHLFLHETHPILLPLYCQPPFSQALAESAPPRHSQHSQQINNKKEIHSFQMAVDTTHALQA